jgi:hypothetical protein
MITKCLVAAGILTFAAPVLSWGASPELVGTYTGSLKRTSYNAGGVKSKSKVDMIVEIAANDQTTLTLNGQPSLVDGVIFTETNGFAIYTALGSYNTVSYQFKNGTVKGLIHGADGVTPETVIFTEGKFKLKKTP